MSDSFILNICIILPFVPIQTRHADDCFKQDLKVLDIKVLPSFWKTSKYSRNILSYIYSYISIYLSIYLSIYVSIYLSIYLSVYLSFILVGFKWSSLEVKFNFKCNYSSNFPLKLWNFFSRCWDFFFAN